MHVAKPGCFGNDTFTVSQNIRTPYVQNFNFNLQQQITHNISFTAGYVGSKGTKLFQYVDANQVNPLTGTNPYGFPPTMGFGYLLTFGSFAKSNYNSLQTSLRFQSWHGLSSVLNYTWSHSIDWISLSSPSASTMMAQDSYNLRNEKGSSDYDARHHFNISYIYDLPFKGNRLVEGWQISGITTFQSGNPVDIIVSGAGPTGFATRRGNLVGDPALAGGPTVSQWFNTAAFCSPGASGCLGPAVFGNAGRNIVTGPGFNNFDWSIIKRTKIKESMSVEFRTEFFDLFNHPNFGQPGRTVGSSNFGQIINTRFATGDSGSSRQIQFALKLLF